MTIVVGIIALFVGAGFGMLLAALCAISAPRTSEQVRDARFELSNARGRIRRALAFLADGQTGDAVHVLEQAIGDVYQLENGPTYLNDGNNRLTVLLEFLLHSDRFGISTDEATRVLKACFVSVRHHRYPTHSIAHIDFVLVNMGAVGSAYEQGHGILIYARDESLANKNVAILESLHSGVAVQAARLVSKIKVTSVQEQKHRRHNYGLLVRFLSGDVTRGSYYIGRASIRYEDIEKKRVIEWRLRNLIDNDDQKQFQAKIEKFLRSVKKFTTDMEGVWRSLFDDVKPRYAAYRWLLDVGFWQQNKKVYNEDWIDFLIAFFSYTEGSSQLHKPDQPKSKYITVCLGDLSRLKLACEYCGFDWNRLDSPPKRNRVPRDPTVPDGYDVSHVEPQSTHGDGDTVIEPASINRSRGQRPMNEYDPLNLLAKTGEGMTE